ncbi:MAG: TIGR02452 family protein [Bacteroidaceae bacterium]|nr:TIGR02452 family protein [Bacteroidaceae bacterium]MBO7588253.1 TIGR02452 family protein [Bacteroidaceae bacterium]MBP5647567.1 TIGR02452 family protein [Bacteroidaceae bacterium]
MLRAQQWNSQIWLSGWWKASVSRGGDAKRALLAKVFTHNLDIFRDGAYRTETDRVVTLPVSGAFVEDSEMFSAPIKLKNDTIGVRPQWYHFDVLNQDCILVTRDLVEQGYNPALLNMASLYHPGGGVLQGSSAQEEDLCRRSTLAISLYQFSLPGGRYGDLADMVGVKRRAERYPMDNTYGGIYSPGITFFRATKDEGYALLDNPFQAAVISVASLNYNPKHGHNSLDANGNIPEADKPVLKEKIRTILRIGILKGHDSLVLGALGCGAFCTPPAQMARLFHQVLDEEEFQGRFSKIVFAIIDSPSSNNFKPFLKEFSK